MIVAVTEATVELREPEDLRRFHVEAADRVDVAGVLAAAGAGTAAGDDDVFVLVDWLRSAANQSRLDGEWPDQFAAMLDVAASHGWLNADRSAVRAHVERV